MASRACSANVNILEFGHQITAHRLTGFRIELERHPTLGVVGKADGGQVLKIRNRSRPAIDRHCGIRRVEAMILAGVAARRIADNLDVEIGRDGLAIKIPRRPRPLNTEHAPLQKQRVGLLRTLRQIGAIRSVIGGEKRILAIRFFPAFLDRLYRQAHPVGRLMAGHARASIRTDRGEERVPLRIQRAIRQQGLGDARPIPILKLGRKDAPFTRRPPVGRFVRSSRLHTEQRDPQRHEANAKDQKARNFSMAHRPVLLG